MPIGVHTITQAADARVYTAFLRQERLSNSETNPALRAKFVPRAKHMLIIDASALKI